MNVLSNDVLFYCHVLLSYSKQNYKVKNKFILLRKVQNVLESLQTMTKNCETLENQFGKKKLSVFVVNLTNKYYLIYQIRLYS